MKRNINKILLLTSIVTLGITTLTSIPLIINYINGTDAQFTLVTDLHVWLGAIFIISTLSRIILNRKILTNMLK
jgi:hypothetical protein